MKMTDFENMSDEDLQGLSSIQLDEPAEQEESTSSYQEEESAQPVAEDDAGGAEGDDEEVEKPQGVDGSDDEISNQPIPVKKEKAPEQDELPEASTEAKEEQSAETPALATESIDFEGGYKKLIGTPIKANGTEITLKDADEALRLIQKGAGFEKKMEALKPARKSAAILEAAGLLGDDAALSHMIDLYNGNPQALARLVKDLKIDIFSLDLDAGDQYRATSHLQTDEAVIFTETLKEVRTLEGGKEALALIDSWDQKSKDMIWGNALAVRQIYDYKQSGVYDSVANEVERRRTLGQIPASTPFIQAFQMVGDEMAKAASAQSPTPATNEQVIPPVTTPAKPVARTPVHSGPAPRKTETPDARAIAAASPRVGSGAAKAIPDIYSLSDADIEKMSGPPV